MKSSSYEKLVHFDDVSYRFFFILMRVLLFTKFDLFLDPNLYFLRKAHISSEIPVFLVPVADIFTFYVLLLFFFFYCFWNYVLREK